MSRKRTHLPVLLALFWTACGTSTTSEKQPTPTPVPTKEPAAAAKAEPNGPLLWEVTPKGGGKLYLYGTMHTGGKDFIPQLAFDKLATATLFAMEADIKSANQFDLIKRAMLPAGESLDKIVGAENWPKILAAVKGTELDNEEQLKKFKPWFVAMFLTLKLLPPNLEAVDTILLDKAKEQGAQIEYLETVDSQLDALEAAMDKDVLIEMVADMPKQKEMMDKLTVAYRAGDTAGLEALFKDPAGMSEKALELLIYQRNRNWIPKIEAYAASGKVGYVAVGAGHLIGKGGVVDLLRANGHTVVRVPATAASN